MRGLVSLDVRRGSCVRNMGLVCWGDLRSFFCVSFVICIEGFFGDVLFSGYRGISEN